MKQHSEAAWNIASKFSHALASETRDLAAHIDEALAAERERCAKVARDAALPGYEKHHEIEGAPDHEQPQTWWFHRGARVTAERIAANIVDPELTEDGK